MAYHMTLSPRLPWPKGTPPNIARAHYRLGRKSRHPNPVHKPHKSQRAKSGALALLTDTATHAPRPAVAGKAVAYNHKAATLAQETVKRNVRKRGVLKVPAGLGKWLGPIQRVQWAREGYINGIKIDPKASGVTQRYSSSRRDYRYQNSTAGRKALRKAQRESERD